MHKTSYDEISAYKTKDGSIIRELMHPDLHSARHQSLTEATIPAGASTALHKHVKSEEIYHIKSGRGIVRLGKQLVQMSPGDTLCISPATPHNITNVGEEPLVFLCCCSPPYSHEDTELL